MTNYNHPDAAEHALRYPLVLESNIALAYLKMRYKRCPADFAYPPGGVLQLAVELRDCAPRISILAPLRSFAKHLALGHDTHTCAYLWAFGRAATMRARWKQKLHR